MNSMSEKLDCKICQSQILSIQCFVDFNELYHKNELLNIPKTGELVCYYRCHSCGFVFTNHLDAWSTDQLRRSIYNDAYELIDSEYKVVRPKFNVERFLSNFWVAVNETVLDFGGGTGVFSSELARLGVSVAHTYDTFAQSTPDSEFLHAYDYVTAFEVLEHTTNPLETFAHLFSLMKRTGLVVISTLCAFDTAGDSTHKDMLERYAYLSPKVGHVSVFSIRSLQMIAEMHGLNCLSLDIGYHVFYNPEFNDPNKFFREGAS